MSDAERSFPYLLKEIDREIIARRDALTEGQMDSYEQYKEQTGILQGLRWARVLIVDTAERAE